MRWSARSRWRARPAARSHSLCPTRFCVDRHRDGFVQLIDDGRIDILFANQAEVEALAGVAHLESAVAAVKDKVETLVVTRSEHGALAIRGGERADVPAEPIEKLVDTTGAGDLFAAGFLLGDGARQGLEQSLRLGAICAAEVIQHYGARPEADLRALAGELARLVRGRCRRNRRARQRRDADRAGASAASSGTSTTPRPTWLRLRE